MSQSESVTSSDDKAAPQPAPSPPRSDVLITQTEFPAAIVGWKSSNDWREAVFRQLDAIESLPSGWDSNRAAPANARLLNSARSLLGSLCSRGWIARPHVSPTPRGGVQFEWEASGRYFEIEIVAERAAEFLFQDLASQTEIEGEIFEGEAVDRVVKYISQVAKADPMS
jgi:hypothetical protein